MRSFTSASTCSSASGASQATTWRCGMERSQVSCRLVGFQARFGKVQVQVLEGIELDSEPYEVAFHHDKSFLHLQTTF